MLSTRYLNVTASLPLLIHYFLQEGQEVCPVAKKDFRCNVEVACRKRLYLSLSPYGIIMISHDSLYILVNQIYCRTRARFLSSFQLA